MYPAAVNAGGYDLFCEKKVTQESIRKKQKPYTALVDPIDQSTSSADKRSTSSIQELEEQMRIFTKKLEKSKLKPQ